MNAIAQVLETPAHVDDLSYTDLIALMEETNRCPGGLHTIRWIARECFVRSETEMLEIGSNTGFTSLEMSRLTGCRAVGIDINEHEVAVANDLVCSDVPDIASRVSFQTGSAYSIPFGADCFDLVVAGGAYSFMDQPGIALRETARVMKPWAHLSITNLCSLETPDPRVMADVSDILGVSIAPSGSGDWVALFDRESGLQRVATRVERLAACSEEKMDTYVDWFSQKPHIQALSEPVRVRALHRWRDILATFNRNHENLGFVRLIYRKTFLPQEPELFSMSEPDLPQFLVRH